MVPIIVILVVVLAIVYWCIKTVNGFKKKEIRVQDGLPGIEVALTKRCDMLTKMLDTAKDYMAHESELFTRVIELRHGMSTAEMNDAQQQMDTLSGKFFAVAENDPKLRSSSVFVELQRGICNAEEHLQAMRRLYNNSVTAYNTALSMFPAKLLAGWREPVKFFTVDASKREDLKMTFLKGEMIMREKQTITNEQLEVKLKSLRVKATFNRILTYITLAVFVLALFFWRNILAVVVSIVMVFVFRKLASRSNGKIKKLLSENVINDVVKKLLGDTVEYNPSGALNPGGIVVPFSYCRSSGSHHIKAVYNGVNIELGNINLIDEEERTDEEGITRHETSTRFRGPWIICDFGKKPACNVYISECTEIHRSIMKSNVNIDNEQFRERFCVRANDPQEAYKILTPQMMNSISAAADKSGCLVYMSFLKDGKMHIAIHTGHDIFDIGKSYDDVEVLRQKFSKELLWLIDIIDTLNVKERNV